MAGLSTHVLDTSTGLPAAGVDVTHSRIDGENEVALTTATTDSDGRIKDLLNGAPLSAGHHRLTFKTGERTPFYPVVTVDFHISETDRHHHIPLLLSPFGYSTYRGS